MTSVTVRPDLEAAGTRRAIDRLDAYVAATVVLALLARVSFLSSAPVAALAYRTTDDAYYYFKVAQNIVAGSGVTFDGVNATNGFHPLWMCVILPIFALTRGDPELSLRLVCSLQALLAAGSFAFCWSYMRRLGGTRAALCALLIFLHPAMLNLTLNGLETGLLIFLLFFALWLSSRWALVGPAASSVARLVLGVLLGLIFLCRLDTVFVVVSVALAVWLFESKKLFSLASVAQLARRYGLSVLVFVGVVAPYFAWNLLGFGHLMPISGALKSSFPHPALRLSQLLSVTWLPYTGALAITLAWVFMALIRPGSYLRSRAFPGWRASGRAPFIAALWLATLLHGLFVAVFLKWGAYYWHFASHVPVIIVLFSLALGALIRKAARPRVVFSVIAAALLVAVVGTSLFERAERGVHHRPWYDAAIWARANTPANSTFAMTDCGLFGYFSQRRTVNLDGVINGYQYQEVLRAGNLRRYLSACGVTHIVDYEVPTDSRSDHRIILPARLSPAPGYELLLPQNAAVYASPPYRQRCLSERHSPPIQFMIWDYAGAQVLKRR
jgi:hypothetical protein